MIVQFADKSIIYTKYITKIYRYKWGCVVMFHDNQKTKLNNHEYRTLMQQTNNTLRNIVRYI